MTKIKSFLILSLFIILGNTGYSQESGTNNFNSHNLEIINKDILYSLVIAQEKNGNFSTGFLIGLKSDTLVIHSKDQNRDIAINDLISISIETPAKGGMRGVAIGGILGTYVFFLAFMQAENEPFAYWQNDSPGGQALVSSLGALLGSAVGYAIDISPDESTEIFNFSGDDANRNKELQRLKKFLTGSESASKLHLNFQLSQVSTRLSELENDQNGYPYSYRDVTSFNLLRKIQMTYSILDELEIGGAVSWFGEPSVSWYNYTSGTNENSSGEQTYKGTGYYAIAVYNPFHSIFPETLSWKVGAGIGSGNVDYELTEFRNSGFTQGDTTIASFNKSLFSAIIYTQFDLYLYDMFSLGLVADYIYLPKEIPEISELDIRSRNLGNFSFGLTLG
ncbi:MAG: hypothetical protein KJO12_03005, partial [Ignavibacteria bacterium]|nr:hypothetical protein [Ignavibacteria bacterium]